MSCLGGQHASPAHADGPPTQEEKEPQMIVLGRGASGRGIRHGNPRAGDHRRHTFGDWRDPVDPRNHGTRRWRTQALLLRRISPGAEGIPAAPRQRSNDQQEGSLKMGWDDKLENKKDEAKGAAKEQLGKATDDEQMQREGKTDQTKSNLKQAGEKVKDAFRKD